MGELSFKFKEEDCIKMILEFLENRDLNISQLLLERETGVTNGNFSDDLLFLRQLILDGQWDHVFEFISPLESLSSFNKNAVHYILNKYKYIELLCIKIEIGHYENAENCVKKIVDCLNELEKYCPTKEDYNEFCLLLTLDNFNQHSDYKNWNPSKSRIKCFNELIKFIEKFLPVVIKKTNNNINKLEVKRCSKGDRLMQIIIRGLLYESCLEYCQNRAINSSIDKCEFEFSQLLNETKLNRSDSSLLSWLQSIPNSTFNSQFEDKKLNINIDKLDKPFLIATWSEQMLTSPIKPGVFPHSATPFTRLKATDLMSKSLTSGIVDGLSKSIMNFSLKDVINMSNSSIATTEFHLNKQQSINNNNNNSIITNNNSNNNNSNNNSNSLIKSPDSPVNKNNKDNKDERLVEKMFEQGNVFNSSVFGKLSTINEGKLIQDSIDKLSNLESNSSTQLLTNSTMLNSLKTNQDDGVSSIEEMKMQLEQFADAQWKEFLKKKDELLMSSVTKSTINELKQHPINRQKQHSSINYNISSSSSNNNDTYLLNKNLIDHMTPVNQTGQSNFKDLQSLITSTPKATPKEEELELNNNPNDYNPIRLNFSGISIDNNSTMTSNHNQNNLSTLNETSSSNLSNDLHNHTAKLANSNFKNLNTMNSIKQQMVSNDRFFNNN